MTDGRARVAGAEFNPAATEYGRYCGGDVSQEGSSGSDLRLEMRGAIFLMASALLARSDPAMVPGPVISRPVRSTARGAAVPGYSRHRARRERPAVGAVVRGGYPGRAGELRGAGDQWRRRQDVVGAEAGHRSAVLCAGLRSVLVARSAGRLWLFWTQSAGHWDGRGGVWAITTIRVGEARRSGRPRGGFRWILLNKPTVLKNGDWLFPIILGLSESECRLHQ